MGICRNATCISRSDASRAGGDTLVRIDAAFRRAASNYSTGSVFCATRSEIEKDKHHTHLYLFAQHTEGVLQLSITSLLLCAQIVLVPVRRGIVNI